MLNSFNVTHGVNIEVREFPSSKSCRLDFTASGASKQNYRVTLDDCNRYLESMGIPRISEEAKSRFSSPGTLSLDISHEQAIGVVLFIANEKLKQFNTKFQESPDDVETLGKLANVIVEASEFPNEVKESFKMNSGSVLHTAVENLKLKASKLSVQLDPEAKAVADYNEKVIAHLEAFETKVAGKGKSKKEATTVQFSSSKDMRASSIHELIQRARAESASGKLVNVYQIANSLKAESRQHQMALSETASGAKKFLSAKSPFAKLLDEIDSIRRPAAPGSAETAAAAAAATPPKRR